MAIPLSFSIAVSALTSKLIVLFVIASVCDITFGYIAARLHNEAQSNRLREGIARRAYILILNFLLVLFVNIVPGASSSDILGTPVSVADISLIGFVIAEFKSIMEKAGKLGLENHPVIRFIDMVVSLPYKKLFTNGENQERYKKGRNEETNLNGGRDSDG